MKEFIEVYDDIFSKDYINTLEDIILTQGGLEWKFNPNISESKNVKDNSLYGFHHYFYDIDNPSQFNYDLSFYFFQILYKSSFTLNFSILNILKARIFLQTPSPNPSISYSAIHTDLNIPHWVCIYYVNDAEGDTVFFNNQKEEIKRVTPKKGRIILFNGSILHTGGNPNTLRSIINFNFIGEKL